MSVTLRGPDGGEGSEGAVYSAYVGHNAAIFPHVMRLHVPVGSTVADVTFGRGTFWKKIDANAYRVFPSDIQTGVDCRSLPYESASLDAVVLDPPYMEGLFRPKAGQMVQHGDFTARYSQAVATTEGGPKYHGAVLQLYMQAGAEAARVLKPGGKLIAKCQDEVSNHKQHWTHLELMTGFQELGLTALDLIVVVRPDRPSTGRIHRQVHARKRHSYFLVFKRDR